MMMRTMISRRGSIFRAMAMAALAVAIAGCSDILAVAGLSSLGGYWSGPFDSQADFYLDLHDDIYGLYGRAGLTAGGSSGYIYVDGERDGDRVVFYDADDPSSTIPLFEGRVTGRDRIDGLVYLDVVPKHVTLSRD